MSAAVPKQLKLPETTLPRTMAEWRRYAHELERRLMLLRMAHEKLKAEREEKR